ncbi:MAG: UDP-N-acetylmuramate dehydrogenase [Actinomycetes bacterium]
MTELLPPVWTPRADPAQVAEVAARIAATGLEVQRDRPLGPLTTFGIGGPTAVFVEPSDVAQLVAMLRALGDSAPDDVPVLVLGRGSNLLVSDAGFPGIVVRLGKGFAGVHRDGDQVTAGAAMTMPQLAAWSAKQGLAGLEFAAAIPASVGGSVRMNAGAHGGEVGDHLVSAEVMLAPDGESQTLARAALGLAYRHSELPARSLVVAAKWQLSPDEPATIKSRLDRHREYRRATQPLRARSCGSTFTNPEGDSAGRIVEAAGLKGLRIGGARVSEKHANFIVVDSGTRATDVLAVIVEVRRAVLAAGGPRLEPEVRVVGDFDNGHVTDPT